MITDRVTVQEAAKRLGVKHDATSQDATQAAVVLAKEETISERRDQVDFLRRELERKDAILMSLTQGVPVLEAPAREPAAFHTNEDGAVGHSRSGEGVGATPVDREPQKDPDGVRAPWWRRWFGG
jgi:hypothetical protein